MVPRVPGMLCSACVSLALLLVSPSSPSPGDPPRGFAEAATKLADSKIARTIYIPLMRAGIEGISWVRLVYGPAEYLLLGAPSLAISVANGGPLGPAKKITWDAATAAR